MSEGAKGRDGMGFVGWLRWRLWLWRQRRDVRRRFNEFKKARGLK